MTVEFLQHPAFWIVLAAISELLALNPKMRANSIIQLVLQALYALKPGKKH